MPIHVIFHVTLFKFRFNSSCCECGLLRRAYEWLNRKINVKIKCSQSNKQAEKSWYRCWPLVTLLPIINDSSFFFIYLIAFVRNVKLHNFSLWLRFMSAIRSYVVRFFLCSAYVSCIDFNSCFNFRFEWVNKKWIDGAAQKKIGQVDYVAFLHFRLRAWLFP